MARLRQAQAGAELVARVGGKEAQQRAQRRRVGRRQGGQLVRRQRPEAVLQRAAR